MPAECTELGVAHRSIPASPTTSSRLLDWIAKVQFRTACPCLTRPTARPGRACSDQGCRRTPSSRLLRFQGGVGGLMASLVAVRQPSMRRGRSWILAGKFKAIEEQYEREVHGVSLGPSWVGQSADAANYRFTVTLKELQGAQKEAKAIASILRDSHTQLAALRGRVNTVRADAIKDGMRVSDQGVVSFNTEQLGQSARSTYMTPATRKVCAQVTRWGDLRRRHGATAQGGLRPGIRHAR